MCPLSSGEPCHGRMARSDAVISHVTCITHHTTCITSRSNVATWVHSSLCVPHAREIQQQQGDSLIRANNERINDKGEKGEKPESVVKMVSDMTDVSGSMQCKAAVVILCSVQSITVTACHVISNHVISRDVISCLSPPSTSPSPSSSVRSNRWYPPNKHY